MAFVQFLRASKIADLVWLFVEDAEFLDESPFIATNYTNSHEFRISVNS